ncbi:MAG: fatty acid--CoA ligase [Steroidobacteraceae bacterium]
MIRLLDVPGGRPAEPLLVGNLLRTPLAVSPAQEIVYRGESRYDYRTLQQRIGRLASSLARLGVTEGTTVAMMDWDSHRYLEAYFAVPMMGAVLMTVNLRLSAGQIRHTLDHAQAEVLLVHADFLDLVGRLAGALPRLRRVVVLEPPAGADLTGVAGEYEALLARETAAFPFREFDENAVATTFYTTGTTGAPKAVCFSHRQLVLHTLGVLGALASPQFGQSVRHGDVYMPLTPMFHVHAWGLPYVASLLGLKQVYPGRYDADRILALRRDEQVTYSHCVPTILQMLLSAPSAATTDFSGWKITVGGSAMSTALARQALERGIDVFAAYGMSETCPFLLANRLLQRSGTGQSGVEVGGDEVATRCLTGLPLPLVDLRIVDEQMNDVPRDGRTVGELVVRAPWLTAGYVGDPDASAELWAGGYLHTRDIASIDPAGYVQIRDRAKDMIKSGGEWISSLQLEELIARHPCVAEVAVIAVQDERWGERPMPVIVPRGGAGDPPTIDDITRHLEGFVAAGTIARYALPDRIELVDALPRTSVGKLDKKALRSRYN